MTITFYILLGILNITKTRELFNKKRLENKLNVFLSIYTSLWGILLGISIVMYFVSLPFFILCLILLSWFIAEIFINKAVFIYGKNKEILQNEFMNVYGTK